MQGSSACWQRSFACSGALRNFCTTNCCTHPSPLDEPGYQHWQESHLAHHVKASASKPPAEPPLPPLPSPASANSPRPLTAFYTPPLCSLFQSTRLPCLPCPPLLPVQVATPEDPASARRGESLYAFIPRSVWGNFVDGYGAEARRLARRGIPLLSPQNRRVPRLGQAWVEHCSGAQLWGPLYAVA